MENALAERLEAALATKVLKTRLYVGEITLDVEVANLHAVLHSLKHDFGFDYLVDIGATDHFTDAQRFEVFYNVFNLDKNQRVRVSTRVEETAPEVPTATDIWPGANWHEREAWDMLGIRFTGHPDLRRMFLPEDFAYHPLRKEFPLVGIPGSLQLPEQEIRPR